MKTETQGPEATTMTPVEETGTNTTSPDQKAEAILLPRNRDQSQIVPDQSPADLDQSNDQRALAENDLSAQKGADPQVPEGIILQDSQQ